MNAAALGRALARWLTPRAALTCLRASAIPAIDRVARTAPTPCPPAAAPIWLWCAGATVDRSPLTRALGDEAVAAAIELGLIDLDGDRVRPALRLAPVGAGLVPCDRADAAGADRVPWPDDSSLHLCGALAGARPRRWLDLGTGPATAPLAVGARGAEVRATDRSARAIELARLGLALAGRDDVALATVDGLGAPGPGWDLITLNAPVPRERADALPATGWHVADDGAALLAAVWRDAPAVLAEDGAIVIHAVDDDRDRYAPPTAANGELTIARYTPPGTPPFAIYRYRPHRPGPRRRGHVALAPGRPFVTATDLDAIAADDALAGADLR